jgi:hypothetical protein
VAIVCAPRDTYFPQAQWHELQRRLPGVQVSTRTPGCAVDPHCCSILLPPYFLPLVKTPPRIYVRTVVADCLLRCVLSSLRMPVQAVMEPQQRHGFCVSVELSRQMAETTIRLVRWSAADLPEAHRPHTPEQSV